MASVRLIPEEEATGKVRQARGDRESSEKAHKSASAELTKLEERLDRLRRHGASGA